MLDFAESGGSVVVANYAGTSEQAGINLVHKLYKDGVWKQTSYNTRYGEQNGGLIRKIMQVQVFSMMHKETLLYHQNLI